MRFSTEFEVTPDTGNGASEEAHKTFFRSLLKHMSLFS